MSHHWTRAFTAKPYTPREGFGVLWRNLFGANFSNPAGVQFEPRSQVLNDITPVMTLGFGGDLMSMFEKPIRFDESVKAFFQGCDHVILNFEGVITDEKQIAPDQKHTRPILQALDQIAARDRLVLSLANNHTGDFGEAACRDCMTLLRQEGFTHFGVKESPFIDLGEHLRIVTGTQYSNREGCHLAWLSDPTEHLRPGAFNVAFPHWGYELETYPRPELVERMKAWLQRFDAVVGHHSHTPQPITCETVEGVRKLAAYSLGDLCFGMAYRLPTFKYYIWGALARIEVGPLKRDPSRWAVGQMDWQFIECRHLSRTAGFEVRIAEHCDLFQGRAAPPASVSAT